MRGKRFIAVALFSILTTSFLPTCLCFAEQSKDESEFKAIVAEANSFNNEFGEHIARRIAGSAADKMLQQRQSELNMLITRLRQFTIDYPTSVYADDAAYILTSFWKGEPERYIQESRLFLEKYPKAALEPFTLDNLQTLDPSIKEIGVIDTVKMDISQTLYDLKRYEESAKEAKAVIDDLSLKALSTHGYRILSLNYYYLMKDYEAQADSEQVKKVCTEAIEKIPNAKDKESFIKKLKELDSVSK